MPGRVKGAWNLISKLAIVLIWKNPTRLKFHFFLTFVYNKTGADSSEWFDPAENRHKKGSSKTKTKERSSSHKTTANPIQPSRSRKSSSKNKPVNPVVSSTGGNGASSSQVTATNAGQQQQQKVATGAVYIITMNPCDSQPSPPFGKVGKTDRTASACKARVEELQTGNPHKLICKHMFLVTKPKDAEKAAHKNLTKPPPNNFHLKTQRGCGGGKDWFRFPNGQVGSLINRVRGVITDGGWFVSEESFDWVESSINPSLSPNQSPQFVYNSRWRQVPCIGDELQHITYNCKWHFSEVTCVTIARSRKWLIKRRYSNKRRTFTGSFYFFSLSCYQALSTGVESNLQKSDLGVEKEILIIFNEKKKSLCFLMILKSPIGKMQTSA